MKRLTLLRHAKSSWANHGLTDFDRPLNDRGLRDAPMMSQRLLDQSWTPDYILCSSANRTQQTAQFVLDAHELNTQHIAYQEALYLATAGTILNFIQETSDDVKHLMIIGHNPGLETLGRQLHPGAPNQLATCAMLNFELHNDSYAIQPDTQINLVLHDFPKSNL